MKEIAGKYYLSNAEIRAVNSFCDNFLSHESYIYEVMRVIKNTPMFVEDHLMRLSQTFTLQNSLLPYSEKEIYTQIHKLIEINKLAFGNIKIAYSKNSIENKKPEFLIYVTPHEYPTEDDFRNGVCVKLFEGVRENPNAKVMVTSFRQEANEIKASQNCYELLLVDDNKCITEGSRSNVFFIKGNKVYTPPTSDVLPGITRKHIIAGCINLNINIIECKINSSEITEFDAVFISGTSRKVLPVRQIDSIVYSVDNPYMRKIQQDLENQIDDYIKKKKNEI
ncbi:MAG: aminotransferase class IV [Bacteroidetes bacterium]|nr:aminotransferase class IV [Bacteroidota bacterium]